MSLGLSYRNLAQKKKKKEGERGGGGGWFKLPAL